MDVANAGAANAVAYGARAAALVAAHPGLVSLDSLITDARPTTNVKAYKISLFDAAGAVLDTRSLFIEQHGNRDDGLRAFERAQGPAWLARRQGFEDLWDLGRTFVYAVANSSPDHPGLLSYGPFCLAIALDRVNGPNSAVFPGNTGELYGRESGPPDAGAAHADVGCWSFVSDMAVAVFGDDAATMPVAHWPELLCNEDQFLEVVVAGPIDLADVVEVRISSDVKADLNAWAIQERRGVLTDEGKRNSVAAWRAIRRWINTTHTHIELRII